MADEDDLLSYLARCKRHPKGQLDKIKAKRYVNVPEHIKTRYRKHQAAYGPTYQLVTDDGSLFDVCSVSEFTRKWFDK